MRLHQQAPPVSIGVTSSASTVIVRMSSAMVPPPFRLLTHSVRAEWNPSRFRLRISLPATSKNHSAGRLLLGRFAFTRSSEASGGCQEICGQLMDVYDV